jgi:hypothetical protein
VAHPDRRDKTCILASSYCSLISNHGLLGAGAPPISAQCAKTVDDTMAGYQPGNRIAPDGCAGCTTGSGMTRKRCQLPVGTMGSDGQLK